MTNWPLKGTASFLSSFIPIRKVYCMSDRFHVAGAFPIYRPFGERIGLVGEPAASPLKWLLDRILAFAILIVASPVIFLVAVAIRLDSPGPIFFRQLRFGLGGEEVRITKFRTMHSASADHGGCRQASRNDERVTRVGAFLRKRCLDELPQLWDVICGRMSLVGPRPHPVRMMIADQLASQVISGYGFRLRTLPGITGLAQVEGNRGPISDVAMGQARIDLDNAYIDHWSLWLDLKILLRTVSVPLQKGCY